jgi:hypothetical protein
VSDGSETSPSMHAVQADVKKIRQLRVHDRAPFFFRFALFILSSCKECLIETNKKTHYFYVIKQHHNYSINNQQGSTTNNNNPAATLTGYYQPNQTVVRF